MSGIAASRVGFKALLMATTVMAALDVRAEEKKTEGAIELAPVSVEGQAPDIITGPVISQQKIDREQPQDLRGLFSGETAVRIGGSQAASQKIYVHGIEQGKLNVTIDGAAQPGNIWHHNGSTTIDPTFLKAVAVDAGVAPADAGPGTMAGAIRMETKDAHDMLLPGQHVGGTVVLGYNTNSQSLRTTGAGYAMKDGFEVLGMGTRLRGENYINGNGDQERGTAENLLSGLAKLGYEAKSGDRIMLSGEYVEDEGSRRYRPNMGVVGNNAVANALNYTRTSRLSVGTSFTTTRPTDTYDPKVTLNYNRTTLHRPPEAHATNGVMNASVDTIGLTVQNTLTMRNNGKVTVGVDYRGDDTHVGSYNAAIGDSDETRRNFGAFVQARLNPTEDLKLSTGLRADYQLYDSVDGKDFQDGGLSPNVSAEYALDDRFTLLGGYSYVWGGLELPEMGLFHVARYRYVDDLESVKAHNGRLGLRYGQGGLGVEAGVFRTVIHNPLYTDDTARVRRNGGALRTQGFDLSSKYEWSNAQVSAKYTFTDTRYAGRMARPSDYNSGVPVGHILDLGGSYRFDDIRLTVGGSTEMALGIHDSSLAEEGFQPIKGYQTVDLFSEWQPSEEIQHWTLRLEANNVLDQKYIDRGTFSTQTLRGVTPVYAEGRSFYLVSTLKF
jgi:hemoglobin/transferrin/lactoferrin receptor protein